MIHEVITPATYPILPSYSRFYRELESHEVVNESHFLQWVTNAWTRLDANCVWVGKTVTQIRGQEKKKLVFGERLPIQ